MGKNRILSNYSCLLTELGYKFSLAFVTGDPLWIKRGKI